MFLCLFQVECFVRATMGISSTTSVRKLSINSGRREGRVRRYLYTVRHSVACLRLVTFVWDAVNSFTLRNCVVDLKSLLSALSETKRMSQPQLHLPPTRCCSKPIGERHKLCETLEFSLSFYTPGFSAAFRQAALC